ncbi:hypothetical protein FQZ97_760810 [compost metagenome]
MPSITPMMSATRREASLMPCMVSITWPTTSPPLTATPEAVKANWLACLALSALWRTVDPSCSMVAAVCCRMPYDRITSYCRHSGNHLSPWPTSASWQ